MNSIDLKSILAVLQYSSISISGLLALLGLLHSYKDKDTGKLTRWGRIALVGLILSVLTGVISKTVELNLQRKAQESEAVKARIASEQTLAIVTNVERMASSVQKVHIELGFWVPMESPIFGDFRDALQERLGGVTQYDNDFSPSQFRNLIASAQWRRIADALLNPREVEILIYPKGTDLPSCVMTLDNQPMIRFNVSPIIESIEYPQDGRGFGFEIKQDITPMPTQRPQVMSLVDFNDATAIVYCLSPKPVLREVPPVAATSQKPSDSEKPVFDESFPATPWKADDLEFTFDEYRHAYINSFEIREDCTRLAYSIAPIAAQMKK